MKKKTKHTLINIGSGKDMRIIDYAKKIIKNFNLNFKITKNKKMPDGIKRKLLNISIAKSYGWKPKYSLKQGIDITIKDYLNSLRK